MEENNETEKKTRKTYKDYYADPEFKKRHLSYMAVKVKCPGCGFTVCRSNMTKHKRTIRHRSIEAIKEKMQEEFNKKLIKPI